MAMPDLTEYIETFQAAEKLNFNVEHVRSPLGDARRKFAGDLDWPHPAGAKEIAGKLFGPECQHEQTRSQKNPVRRPHPQGVFIFLILFQWVI